MLPKEAEPVYYDEPDVDLSRCGTAFLCLSILYGTEETKSVAYWSKPMTGGMSNSHLFLTNCTYAFKRKAL